MRARTGDGDAFGELVEPYRRELHAHCYRILGSTQDAEDVLQETLLAAWRGLASFQERSSLRGWLYRIATNRCLNALRDGGRRPSEETGVAERPEPVRWIEPVWLQPFPDALLEGIADVAPGPEARYDVKESLTLAFVIALQQLPPRQRAVVVLRDVLGFRAAEVAGILDTSEYSVNSALKRARGTLDARRSAGGTPQHVPPPESEREREIVQRFADAFENDDIDTVVALLTADAKLTMPPEPLEYHGREAIAGFLHERRRVGPGFRLVHTGANMQPAFGLYLRDAKAPIARAYGVIVLTLADDRICAITHFLDSSVFPQFGLPRTLPVDDRSRREDKHGRSDGSRRDPRR